MYITLMIGYINRTYLKVFFSEIVKKICQYNKQLHTLAGYNNINQGQLYFSQFFLFFCTTIFDIFIIFFHLFACLNRHLPQGRKVGIPSLGILPHL